MKKELFDALNEREQAIVDQHDSVVRADCQLIFIPKEGDKPDWNQVITVVEFKDGSTWQYRRERSGGDYREDLGLTEDFFKVSGEALRKHISELQTKRAVNNARLMADPKLYPGLYPGLYPELYPESVGMRCAQLREVLRRVEDAISSKRPQDLQEGQGHIRCTNALAIIDDYRGL